MIQPTQVKLPFPTKILLACLLVYLVAFAFPVYRYTYIDGPVTMYGYETFFMGATAILGGGTFEWLIWLANPLFFLSVFKRYKQKDTAITFGMLATLIALSFIFWRNILSSESGSTAVIESKGLGYFLWFLGITIWTAGICIEEVRHAKATRNEKK